MFSFRAARKFAADEAGAVSPDWVVLTGGIVGLGLIMINAVGPSAAAISASAGDSYSQTRITLVQATSGEETTTGTEVGVTVGDTGIDVIATY